MNYELMDQAVQAVQRHFKGAAPSGGMILGSGWSDVAEAFDIVDQLNYAEIPGLGATGVVGHAGRLLRVDRNGQELLIFQGRRHYYEGVGWTPIAIPVYILKKLGVKQVMLTNAAGGIRKDLAPGSLMVLSDHINNMGAHPLIGPHHDVWGPRFPDQSTLYAPELQEAFVRAAATVGVPITKGVYLASTGPTYETPAEIVAQRTLGADAAGMSTVPEAMLANAAGLRVAGLSCITNWAAGILDQPLTHEEVTAATAEAMPRMRRLLPAFWDEVARG